MSGAEAGDAAAAHARRWKALWPLLPDDAPAIYEDLLSELARWSRSIALTAEAGPEELALRVVDDALTLAPHVRGPVLLDVGSGAGLPALPLCIALPDLEVRSVEPIAKKVAFTRAFAARHARLRIRPFTGRVEGRPGPWGAGSTVVSRALTAPDKWVELGAPLVAPGGRLLALLGAAAVDGPECAAADAKARAAGLARAGSWSGTVGGASRGIVWYDRAA